MSADNQTVKATPQARRLWEGIPHEARLKLLNNVWCVRCSAASGIVLQEMRVDRGDLILRGVCVKCKGSVARVVETSEATSRK